MENELELKWRRIQQAMRQEEADGCLLTMNMNLYYVSGLSLIHISGFRVTDECRIAVDDHNPITVLKACAESYFKPIQA